MLADSSHNLWEQMWIMRIMRQCIWIVSWTVVLVNGQQYQNRGTAAPPPSNTPAPTPMKLGPTCYNCNYKPEGPSGTSICGLQQQSDFDRVDKWPCKSGMCFIRRDKSGLIYRGCANPENLPFGVSSPQQCLTQVYTGSVWWFCQGTMCNNGTIGDTEARCSGAITAQMAMMAQNPDPHMPSPSPTPVPAPDTQPPVVYMPPTHAPPPPPVPAPTPVPPQMPAPAPTFYPPPAPVWVQAPEPVEVVHMPPAMGEQTYEMPREMEGAGGGQQMMMMQMMEPDKLPNPCDGKCAGNPSGLYPDPRSVTKFIQCGTGYGCSCCKPFYLNCPLRTQFDVVKSVCTTQMGISAYGVNHGH